MKNVIAIDGPAGSGKSSVSKKVAQILGYGYLDTGAAYRALAWAVLEGKISVKDLESDAFIELFDYSISLNPENYWVRVGLAVVTEPIREPRVAEAVSAIAVLPKVREYMVSMTRKLVAESDYEGVVVEGRDITTVIFPEAKNRFLLTASEEVRLERRSAELPAGTAILNQVVKRDREDSKVVDFMVPAEGVKLVDSTDLSFDETVTAVLELIERKRP
jgi:cytidylate kinase